MSSEEKKTPLKSLLNDNFEDEKLTHTGEGKAPDSDTGMSQRRDYMICIDPETFRQYRLDLLRNDIVVDDAKYPPEVKKKIDMHYEIISSMLKMPGFHWMFERSAEVNRYRRRRFPYHYPVSKTFEEASEYPVYIYQSELSKAFSDKVELAVEVDLMEYKELFKETEGQVVIGLTQSLVTSFNEVLKNLLREVYKRYAKKLKPSPDHQFVLKADGYRDYLRGNDSLLAYERVRIVLRKREILKLILTEIPKKVSKVEFPPVLRLSANEKFDYKEVVSVSPLFWYPMQKISQLYLEGKLQRNVIRVDAGKMIKFAQKKRKLNMANWRKLFDLDPATIGEHMLMLKSGECNFRFRFKLVGLEHLHLIFNELTKPMATDNGRAKPSNITLPSQCGSKEGTVFANKSLGNKIDKSFIKIPSVLSQGWFKDKMHTRLPLSSPFSTYLTYCPIFEDYCKEKVFGFVPFALYLQIKIYYGCQKLSKSKFTRKVPFNTNATFNEWIELGDVRVSLLSSHTPV